MPVWYYRSMLLNGCLIIVKCSRPAKCSRHSQGPPKWVTRYTLCCDDRGTFPFWNCSVMRCQVVFLFLFSHWKCEKLKIWLVHRCASVIINECVLFGGRGMDCLCFAFSSSLEATEHVESDVKLQAMGELSVKWTRNESCGRYLMHEFRNWHCHCFARNWWIPTCLQEWMSK